MSGRESAQRREQQRGRLGDLRDDLRSASVIVEIRDARIPGLSSVLRYLGNQAPRCRGVVLTKSDLADPAVTAAWLRRFEAQGIPALALDLMTDGAASGRALRAFMGRLVEGRRGVLGQARVAVVGLPNVGKSTVLNRCLGSNRTRTGDRPGVTKGKQWVRLDDGFAILDTPGVIQLFAGMERELGEQFFKLVLCNVVPAGQYDERDVSEAFIVDVVRTTGRWPFRAYFPEIFDTLATDPLDEVLGRFAVAVGHLASGGVPDLTGGARRLVTDVRRGRIGRWTLEHPPVDDDEKDGAGPEPVAPEEGL